MHIVPTYTASLFLLHLWQYSGIQTAKDVELNWTANRNDFQVNLNLNFHSHCPKYQIPFCPQLKKESKPTRKNTHHLLTAATR